jgi:surface polysaccharide O-acyltransferase-like enzyme
MKPTKLSWPNDLRAIATIAVIVLHVASTISLQYPAISKSFFLTSVFFDSAMRWCVPVFIMLSGSFALEHYDGRMKIFFIKMFYRIILPFLFWSIVYLFFFSWSELTDPAKTAEQLFSFINQEFLAGTASHLWFVYIIVSMYLTFPFLSKWAKVATEKEYFLFLAIWLFFMLLDPYLSQFDSSIDYSYFSGYIGYIVLGNYLFKNHRKINKLLLVAIFLAGFLYTALSTYFISIHASENNETFMNNLSINVCLMAFSVYSFLKKSSFQMPSLWRRMIDLLCLHSYGVYLSHLLILNIFLLLGINFSFIHPLLSIPLITIATLLISVTLIIVMKKIPYLKSLAG